MRKIVFLILTATEFFLICVANAAQHDYVIDNAPGAAVRADINSSLQAIVTNNSGATEPATTYPNMWWYDTSTSLLKRRNNADDAWITVGLEAASKDGTFAANSDSLVPTQKAAKTYADTKISKSTAAEIYNVTEKKTPASNDVLLLEDSAASYAKKSVKISNIRQSIDAVLPSQTGNSGKFLTTNGSASSWGDVSSDWVLESVTSTNHSEGLTYTNVATINPTKRYAVFVEVWTTNAGGNPPAVQIQTMEFNSDTGNNYIQTAGTTKASSISVASGSTAQYERLNFYLDFVEIVKTPLSKKMAVVRDGYSLGIRTGSSPSFNLSTLNTPKTFYGVYQGSSSPTTIRFSVSTGAECTSTSKIYLYALSLS